MSLNASLYPDEDPETIDLGDLHRTLNGLAALCSNPTEEAYWFEIKKMLLRYVEERRSLSKSDLENSIRKDLEKGVEAREKLALVLLARYLGIALEGLEFLTEKDLNVASFCQSIGESIPYTTLVERWLKSLS